MAAPMTEPTTAPAMAPLLMPWCESLLVLVLLLLKSVARPWELKPSIGVVVVAFPLALL